MRLLLVSALLVPVFVSSAQAGCDEPREPVCMKYRTECRPSDISIYRNEIESFKTCVRDKASWDKTQAEIDRVNAESARYEAERALARAKREACEARRDGTYCQ